MGPDRIPEKLYYKIGEVAHLIGVEPYVLRYWETEFREINPIKSKAGQRLYRRRDVDTILRIKRFLYEEGFTIEGARKKLREGSQLALSLNDGTRELLLRKLKGGLQELLKIMEGGT